MQLSLFPELELESLRLKEQRKLAKKSLAKKTVPLTQKSKPAGKSLVARAAEIASISPAARNRLAAKNEGLVHLVAHQLHPKFPSLEYSDIFQVGMIGLLKACERFDPTKAKISSFAVPYIRGEILHFIRDRGAIIRAPRAYLEVRSKYRTNEKRITSLPIEERIICHYSVLHGLQKDVPIKLEEWHSIFFTHAIGFRPRFYSKKNPPKPTAEQIAWLCGTTLDKYQEAMDALSKQTPTSDAVLHYLEDKSLDTQAEYQELREAIDTLPELDRQIIALVFYEEVPARRVAKQLGMSLADLEAKMKDLYQVIRGKIE